MSDASIFLLAVCITVLGLGFLSLLVIAVISLIEQRLKIKNWFIKSITKLKTLNMKVLVEHMLETLAKKFFFNWFYLKHKPKVKVVEKLNKKDISWYYVIQIKMFLFWVNAKDMGYDVMSSYEYDKHWLYKDPKIQANIDMDRVIVEPRKVAIELLSKGRNNAVIREIQLSTVTSQQLIEQKDKEIDMLQQALQETMADKFTKEKTK